MTVAGRHSQPARGRRRAGSGRCGLMPPRAARIGPVSNPSLNPPAASSSQPAERLDSWKEIARYLNRDESTVQRWEKREGMPVHRHVHDKRGSVYAYAAELDAWWQGRRQRLEPKKGNRDIRLELRDRRRWWIGLAAVVVLLPATFFTLKSLSRRLVPAPEASRPLVTAHVHVRRQHRPRAVGRRIAARVRVRPRRVRRPRHLGPANT